MNAQWTARSTYTGPGQGDNPIIPPDWVGSITEVDITASGAYLINQPGLDSASADQFASVASLLPAQAAADYLNLVKNLVETNVPNNWTSVGI